MSFQINVVKDQALDAVTLSQESLLRQTSRSYTSEEMSTIFSLYNRYNPKSQKQDSGCGSCRRQVLNFMTAKWHQLKKESEPNE